MKLELWKDLTWKEALEKERESNGKARILTNKEIDGLLQQGILSVGIFPLWTGTFVKYDGTECEVTENGKTTKCNLPLEDGWYLPDKIGIPNGKPSDKNNQEARYLWRIEKNETLLSRYYYGWDGGNRRYVSACDRPGGRLGVLGVSGKFAVPKHKHEWACKTRGVER